MQIAVKKYLFFGLYSQKEAFFKEAQKWGIIQFIPQKRGKERFSPEWERLTKACEILSSLVLLEKREERGEEKISVPQLVQQVIQLEREIEDLQVKRKELAKKSQSVAHWGDFSSDTLREIERNSLRSFQFFSIKKEKRTTLPSTFSPIAIKGERVYLLYLGKEDPRVNYPFLREESLIHSHTEYQREERQVEENIYKCQQALQGAYRPHFATLQRSWIREWNLHHLREIENSIQSHLDGRLFVIEGWVPESESSLLKEKITPLAIHHQDLLPGKGEQVPSYLENRELLPKIGEDLVSIYDTPSPQDGDPSLWVLCSFSLFFGMILGDGGYGIILLLLFSWLWKKYSSLCKGIGRRMLSLLGILSLTSLGWGLLSGTFFGYTLSPEHTFMRISPLYWLVEKKALYHFSHGDATFQGLIASHSNLVVEKCSDLLSYWQGSSFPIFSRFFNQISLELSLFVGMIHLISSLVRNLKRAPAGWGWILFLLGIYLYAPSIIEADSILHILFPLKAESCFFLGKILLLFGLGLSALIGVVRDRAAGMLEITNGITVFSDLLSYLRLYALAMCGAIMSHTFNDMGSAIGGILGGVVFCLGHTINFSLSLMSGVIHGLRLNFLEWYHHCFEGGGRRFSPLRELKEESISSFKIPQ